MELLKGHLERRGRGWLLSQGVGRGGWEGEESVRSFIGGVALCHGWGFIDSGFYFLYNTILWL
ncbi:hypothetical protein E2320_013177 [Naja naja]|nr:hypothetical protein E2320_013177 [Naja naja]